MAKTETFSAACSKVGSFSYYNNFTLYVQLTDRDGSSSTNKSYVDYKVYCSSNGSGSLDSKHAIYFSINGSEKVNKTVTWTATSPYISLTIAEGTIEVTHDDDGNKSIPFSASIKANSYGVSASKSGNFSLEKINRYFTSTPSITASSKTLTSITFKWSTSQTCDRIDYSLNGTNKGQIWTGSATSGTLTVSGLNPNTKYSIYIWCRRKDSQLGSTSNTISVTTYDIARLTEAPNINIGSSHTIKWTNPGSATTSLKLCKTDGTQVINYGTVTGTSKSVTPTASTIYALTPNSNSITLRYILTTTQGSYTTTNYKDCKFSVTNSNPTFSNFTYKDTDSTVTALTGNNQTIVKGYSNVQGIVSTANKATAKNSATMSKYRLSIGEATAEVGYSSSAEVSATIANVSSNSFTMYAIDSRGNSTSKTITASTYINYSPIKITSISAIRTNSVTSETTLKFSGNVWNGSFGSVTNSIVTCYYRYRLSTSSTWTTGATTITPTKSGTSFSYSGIIKGDLGANGFNIDNSYVIQVIVADKLSGNSSNPATFTLGPGTPAMAIYKNNVAIGQRYSTSEGGKLQVNGTSLMKGRVLLKDSPVNFGGTRENTVANSYVKLFRLKMTGPYKNTSIWFTLCDTQATNENLLCNLYARMGSETAGVSVTNFRYIKTTTTFETSRLVAVVIDLNTIDVYFKMNSNDSPSITIISMTKLREYDDQFGKITIDCSTTVTSLPSGNKTYPSSCVLHVTGGTLSGPLNIQGTAASMPLMVRGIVGSDGTSTVSELHLQYGANAPIKLGNTAAYSISADGSLYSGTAEKVHTYVLYDNASGITGNLTLSQSAANFAYLEIFFGKNGSFYDSIKLYSPNNKTAALSLSYYEATTSDWHFNQLLSTAVLISGTTISVKSINAGLTNLEYDNKVGLWQSNELKIYKVVGYK